MFVQQMRQHNENKRHVLNDGGGAHRGRTEDISVQLPLAVDVVLGDLHLETSRLSIKQLHAINRTNYLDVTSFKEKK